MVKNHSNLLKMFVPTSTQAPVKSLKATAHPNCMSFYWQWSWPIINGYLHTNIQNTKSSPPDEAQKQISFPHKVAELYFNCSYHTELEPQKLLSNFQNQNTFLYFLYFQKTVVVKLHSSKMRGNLVKNTFRRVSKQAFMRNNIWKIRRKVHRQSSLKS